MTAQSWTRPCLALMISLVIGAPGALAIDQSCLQTAANDRGNAMKDAYKQYADDMRDAIDRLTKGQNDALKLGDGYQRQNELNRLQSVYSNDSVQVTQTLTYKTQQTWVDYQNKQTLCGGTGSGSHANHGAATYSYTYPYYNTYGYSYGYGYPYNYGNYYNYPYTYGYGNSYQYNRGYWPYSYNYCPQVVLTAAPAGCGYECRYDGNGCQTCEVTCHRNSNANNCACPLYYSPVCGRDGRNYDSPCQAACADTAITHYGKC